MTDHVVLRVHGDLTGNEQQPAFGLDSVSVAGPWIRQRRGLNVSACHCLTGGDPCTPPSSSLAGALRPAPLLAVFDWRGPLHPPKPAPRGGPFAPPPPPRGFLGRGPLPPAKLVARGGPSPRSAPRSV